MAAQSAVVMGCLGASKHPTAGFVLRDTDTSPTPWGLLPPADRPVPW